VVGRIGLHASDDTDPEVVGDVPDPDPCVLVDFLDTSELSVGALNGYTPARIYPRSLGRPITSVVGDTFHQFRLCVGARDETGPDRAHAITADVRATSSARACPGTFETC